MRPGRAPSPAATPAPLSRRARILGTAALAAGFVVHLALGGWAIQAQSPTFDEPLHLAAGVAYWKTRDYRINGYHHPPLPSLVAGLPALALGPDLPLDKVRPQWSRPSQQYRFAQLFLDQNRVPSRRLIAAGRGAILFLSGLFTLALFFATRSLFGPVAAGTAFFLAVFSPEFLAHGSLVTTDFLFSAFYFLFFTAFGRWEESPSNRWAALSGTGLGLAFCSKFSAVAAGPVLALWILARRFRWPFSIRQVSVFLGAGFLAVALVYQGEGLPMFFAGLQYTLERVQEGRATYLWGRHSTTGWWYYFPVLFFLKTPVPVLAGLAAISLGILKKKWRFPWFLTWPPLIYFAAACASSVQIGHRHILPVYPFLYVLLGFLVQRLWEQRSGRALSLAAAVWVAAGTLRAGPFFLSYFQEFTGGARRAYVWVADSNIDWGQGLRELAAYLKRRNAGKIYLSYFGTADPHAEGIRYAAVAPYAVVPLTDDGPGLDPESPHLLVVSVTNFHSTYFVDKDLFAWLKERRPVEVLGGSLLVFDITGDDESHRRVQAIRRREGRE
jgi:hypothetical protein